LIDRGKFGFTTAILGAIVANSSFLRERCVAWSLTNQLSEFERLSAEGRIGFYKRFEVTEILGFPNAAGAPVNVFSLLVGEDRPANTDAAPVTWLNGKKRIHIPGTDWNFGIARYEITPQALSVAIKRYADTGTWNPAGATLPVESLLPTPPLFIPADSYQPHPWNRVLKNNFWGGSYLLEMANATKASTEILLAEPTLLKALAAAVLPFVPIAIDGLSDRLGNVVIQLPVTAVFSTVHNSGNGAYQLETRWHPKSTPRPLRVSCEVVNDTVLTAYAAAPVEIPHTHLPMRDPQGSALRYVVWDDVDRVIVAASAPLYFVHGINLSVSVAGTAAVREFFAPEDDDSLKPQKLEVQGSEHRSFVGKVSGPPNGDWTDQRIYRASALATRESREFIQYGAGTDGRSEHARALSDIRWLIGKWGQHGAWLWDPYLTADDVLKTLFFCSYSGADLRALSAGKGIPPQQRTLPPPSCLAQLMQWRRKPEPAPSVPSWSDIQAARFDQAKGNLAGVKLEFRVRRGQHGWPFHDRFLIFPQPKAPAKAWSLGTSLNSLGRQHHILQHVSDGQLVMDAFLELWQSLAEPEHLVWKTP
jgi:hypothetical protein